MANHWDEYDVSIEHPGMQEAQHIERGATTIDAGNILFSAGDIKTMHQMIALHHEREKELTAIDDNPSPPPPPDEYTPSYRPPTPQRKMRTKSVKIVKKEIGKAVEEYNKRHGDKPLDEKIEELETKFGDNFDKFVNARLMDGIDFYDEYLTTPDKRQHEPKYLRKPDNPHRHAKQVDVAAEIFGALGGKVMEKEKEYEKIREDSVEKMRNNKVYQFCMLLSGFTNERMDKYWITPSEKGSIPMVRIDDDGPVENLTKVKIKEKQTMGSGNEDDDRFNVFFEAANRSMWLTRKDLKYLAGEKFPRTLFGEDQVKIGYMLDVDINKLLNDRRKVPGVSMRRPQVQQFGRANERAELGMDQSINMYPEIGGGFHNWYVSTSWADGKLHLSPMVYAHLEEAHSMLQLKWRHLNNVPLYVFVESDQMRTYFARLVAFNMRISDVLSGKRYHSNATYPRINNERARLLNVFRHVKVDGDELQYYRQGDSDGYVRGAAYTERYLDNLATVQHRSSSTPWQNNMDDLEKIGNRAKNILSQFI